MLPNIILLFSLVILSMLNSHKRAFLQQLVETHAETHGQTLD